jgi:hypothetical protein
MSITGVFEVPVLYRTMDLLGVRFAVPPGRFSASSVAMMK